MSRLRGGAFTLLALAGCAGGPTPDSPADSPVDSLPADTGSPGDALRALDPSTLPAGAAPCAAPRLVQVDYAVDGDTLHVYPEGEAGWISVRLIGLDAPELARDGQPAECWGPESAAFAQALLNGRWAWMSFDAECEDRYGRTLAYLHLGDREDDFVNRHLVRSGQARAYPFDETDTFAEAIAEDEAGARAAGLGLWAGCEG